MSTYELTFILSGQLSQAEAEEAAEKVKGLIGELTGQLLKEHAWGLRTLAYPIKQDTSGYYFTLLLELPTGKAAELEKELRLQSPLIRHLLISLAKERLTPAEVFEFEEGTSNSLPSEPMPSRNSGPKTKKIEPEQEPEKEKV